MHVQNLFLIGPMGAGKTTVGRQLAEQFRKEFIDSDLEIQRRTGVDIPTIFEFEGEQGFRQREQEVIDELTQRDEVVLATGGGAVINEQNRKALSSRGLVIYLHCTVDQQYERTHRDKNRPLLQTDDPMAKLKSLMAERDPLYRQTADLLISTEGRNTQAVVQDIRKQINSLNS
ncbi:MAG: shikimate kinase AroK [Candidatus Thiodiazotropha lotti]|uniref:Shikimate kinase n=1 Tax=Candidatus Thiodiazotropha endoloripes TaxID=1818881 RepID=A0A1E2UMJ7_9GAMM|nr:shikimate kinase AroK [Candidatus Thiodiazotropha endoloripes]MCG7897227.1 shikimate kinase AroK [Candidatus Thiodiazotropha weberae]MCG7991551.1 shikimate kinase AroK [Candidatus Thiodiazotropha lotti]MCG7902205.1 shikimate kinase AroK [Candidatus Thiodiazotropha weberae]MCG7915977.1 shikimate kinase AroK [Candidatus Thiodiazotropha weberae]MCG7999575.1 shikimate kinase AroK [Candidatus Thiodiazotropha lotti]